MLSVFEVIESLQYLEEKSFEKKDTAMAHDVYKNSHQLGYIGAAESPEEKHNGKNKGRRRRNYYYTVLQHF